MKSQGETNQIEILVVEDSPTQAEQLNNLLREHGYSVTVAANGKQALAAARERRPALIISDIVMPEMDGYALCKAIKSDGSLKETPVILVTSLSALIDVVRGIECGADNFIRKPYDRKSLLARIEYILANRELRKDSQVEFGLEVHLAGKKHYITSARRQVLDLLMSTYEEAIRINEELGVRQRELARSYHLLDVLYRAAANLNSSTNIQDVANRAMQHLLELAGVQAVRILLRNGPGGFQVAAATNLPQGGEVLCAMGSDCRCLGKVASGELRQATNVVECAGLQNWPGGSCALVPLRSGNQVLGVVNLVKTSHTLFGDDELRVLSGMGEHVAIALDRAQLLEQLEKKVEERTAALTAENTERKRAEDSLRNSEEQLRLLLDSTAEAIYGLDLQGRCTFCNNSCLRLLRYEDPASLLGQNMHPLIHHTRRDGTPCLEQECRICQAFRKGEKTHVDDEVVWRADGSSFPAEYWSHPVRRGEEAVGAVVTFWDISERQSLEAQFRQSQKMEAIGRLAGGVAHDFNNLLSVIIGYSELLLDGLDPADPMSKKVEEIQQAGQRAASLTRQLLAFSRRQVIEPRVLNLNEVVTNMDKMLRRLIGEDIDLVTLPDPSIGWVKADSGQIEQVIMNLVVNARDAMLQGGKLTIETENVELDEAYARNHVSVSAGSYVMLAVSDTGCGIDAETQSHIFEPFFTTKENGKGTGLGLATVYGIVKQSGGNIWVYSEPGRGATFKIYLPRVEEAVKTVEEPHSLLARGGSETILLVEDEHSVRALVRMTLQKKGYTVLEAANGAEAAHVVQQYEGPIQLLVTDVVMPGIGGWELAQRLAPLRPDMKVLYMSGYTDRAIVHHGVLDAGTAYLGKPFRPADLARKVREVLDVPGEEPSTKPAWEPEKAM